MGYLNVQGRLLTYNEYKDRVENYKKHGLAQFMKIYNAHKDREIERENLHWGEEIEYALFYFDVNTNQVKLMNDGFRLIHEFNEEHKDSDIQLQPEFGNWMVEAVPSDPYNSSENAAELLSSYTKLLKRREVLDSYFTLNGLGLTSMASTPILGTKDHILLQDPKLIEEIAQNEGKLENINKYSKSQFVIDGTENPHPRFPGLMKSIRERRGEKVKILVPIYPDSNTNMTVPTYEEPYPGQIYMDAMHFGMGCSCLQVTYETQNINHAKYLHDMLLPFTPILAALSASAPIYKGKLSDNDMRWTVISQSVDCRTSDERNPEHKNYIPKSRYSTINHYLSDHVYVKDKHFDTIQYKVNPSHVDCLKKQGVDERLAFHIASLFVRDPVPTYDNELDEHLNDDDTTAHFENLQSTNWNSMRFKPPPSKDSKIGWRVEFRSMDIQLTDFENAAMTILLGLIVNVINNYDVDFIMPITMIDTNMDNAHKRDALLKEKFWFKTSNISGGNYRKNTLNETQFLRSRNDESDTSSTDSLNENQDKEEYHQLYIHEILEGKQSINFKGILPLIEEFMQDKHYSKEQVSEIRVFLNFLVERSKGEIITGARYMRDFVLNHPSYQKDSVVSNKIAFDLMSSIVNMNNDPEERAKLLGKKYNY